MAGETNLTKLLRGLSPRLHDGDYVVCHRLGGRYGDHAPLRPFAVVAEAEGLTLVLERERAEAAGLPFEGVFALLTLEVHSSLEAVGLTAAVSGCLAVHGISANVLAAYRHDHVLVPAERAADALAALRELSDRHRDAHS